MTKTDGKRIGLRRAWAFLLCAVLCVATLTACQKKRPADKIEIKAGTLKEAYKVSEFDIGSIVLNVYENGAETPREANASLAMLTTEALNALKTPGEKNITLNYGGKSATAAFLLIGDDEEIITVVFKDMATKAELGRGFVYRGKARNVPAIEGEANAEWLDENGRPVDLDRLEADAAVFHASGSSETKTHVVRFVDYKGKLIAEKKISSGEILKEGDVPGGLKKDYPELADFSWAPKPPFAVKADATVAMVPEFKTCVGLFGYRFEDGERESYDNRWNGKLFRPGDSPAKDIRELKAFLEREKGFDIIEEPKAKTIGAEARVEFVFVVRESALDVTAYKDKDGTMPYEGASGRRATGSKVYLPFEALAVSGEEQCGWIVRGYVGEDLVGEQTIEGKEWVATRLFGSGGETKKADRVEIYPNYRRKTVSLEVRFEFDEARNPINDEPYALILVDDSAFVEGDVVTYAYIDNLLRLVHENSDDLCTRLNGKPVDNPAINRFKTISEKNLNPEDRPLSAAGGYGISSCERSDGGPGPGIHDPMRLTAPETLRVALSAKTEGLKYEPIIAEELYQDGEYEPESEAKYADLTDEEKNETAIAIIASDASDKTYRVTKKRKEGPNGGVMTLKKCANPTDEEKIYGYSASRGEAEEGKKIVIPDYFENKAESMPLRLVLEIADDAFASTSGSACEVSRFPMSVRRIGKRALMGAEAYFRRGGFSHLTSIGDSAFENAVIVAESGSGEIKLGALTALGAKAFAGLNGETDEEEPGPELEFAFGALETVGENAFLGAKRIRKIELRPVDAEGCFGVAPTKEIGAGAFENTGIAEIAGLESAKTVGERAFAGANLETIALPAIETVGEEAFADNPTLKSLALGGAKFDFSLIARDFGFESLELGKRVTEFARDAEASAMLRNFATIEVAKENPNLFASDGALYAVDAAQKKQTLVFCANAKTGECVVVKANDGIERLEIDCGAFAGLGSKIARLDLTAFGANIAFLPEDSVTENAFCVIVDDAKKAEAGTHFIGAEIAAKAGETTYGCDAESGLTYRTVGKEGEKTARIAGADSRKEKIVVPATVAGLTVTGIEDGAFANFSELKELTIEAEIDGWDASILLGADKLETLEIKGWLERVGIEPPALDDFRGNGWFDRNNVIWAGGLAIGYNGEAMRGGKPKTTVSAAEAKKFFATQAGVPDGFFRGSNLTSASFPRDVKIIKSGAFANCAKLVEFGADSLTFLGANAFAGCSSLRSVALNFEGESAMMHAGAFEGCSALESAVVTGAPNGGFLPARAFKDCVRLKAADFEKLSGFGVESESDGSAKSSMAFYNCGDLREFDFANCAAKAIPASAFKGSGIRSAHLISSNLETIGKGAFANCAALEYVAFGPTVKAVGDGAFYGCESLKAFDLPYENGGLYDAAAELSAGAFVAQLDDEDAEVAVFYVKPGKETDPLFERIIAERAERIDRVKSKYPIIKFELADKCKADLALRGFGMAEIDSKSFVTERDVEPRKMTGYKFAGWYRDGAALEPVSFPVTFVEDVTLRGLYCSDRRGTLNPEDVRLTRYIDELPEIDLDSGERCVWEYEKRGQEGRIEITKVPLEIPLDDPTDEITLFLRVLRGEGDEVALIEEYGDVGTTGYSIVGYTGPADPLILPDRYDDGEHGELPITVLRAGAFSDIDRAEFTIPDGTIAVLPGSGLNAVGASTFAECAEKINVPPSVERIGDGVFAGPNVREVNFEYAKVGPFARRPDDWGTAGATDRSTSSRYFSVGPDGAYSPAPRFDPNAEYWVQAEPSALRHASEAAFLGSEWWKKKLTMAAKENNGFVMVGRLAVKYVGPADAYAFPDDPIVGRVYCVPAYAPALPSQGAAYANPLPGFPEGYFVKSEENEEYVPATGESPVEGVAYYKETDEGGYALAIPGDEGKYADPLPGFPTGYWARTGEGTADDPFVYSPAAGEPAEGETYCVAFVYANDADTPLPGFPDGYFARSGAGTADEPFAYSLATGGSPVVGETYYVVSGYAQALPGDGKYADAETTPLPDFPRGYFARTRSGGFEPVPDPAATFVTTDRFGFGETTKPIDLNVSTFMADGTTRREKRVATGEKFEEDGKYWYRWSSAPAGESDESGVEFEFLLNAIDFENASYVSGTNAIRFARVPNGATAVAIGSTAETEARIPEFAIKLGDGIFKGNETLETAYVNPSLTEIGAEAFCGAKNLKTIFHGDEDELKDKSKVERFGKDAFKGTEWHDSREQVVFGTRLLKFNHMPGRESATVRGNVKSIAAGAFAGATNLTSATIESESLESIGAFAFRGASNLKRIVLPKSLKRLGRAAFKGCASLASVDGLGGSSVGELADETFMGCASLSALCLPSATARFGRNALAGCENLCAIEADGLAELKSAPRGAEIGFECGLDDTKWYKGEDETGRAATESQNDSDLILGKVFVRHFAGTDSRAIFDDPNAKNPALEIAIPQGITQIAHNAFLECRYLTGAIVPDGAARIGEYAFARCENLASATFGAGLIEIGAGAFDGAGKLTDATLPDGLERIGAFAFRNTALTSEPRDESGRRAKGADGKAAPDPGYSVPASVVAIGEQAFRGVTTLTAINIGRAFDPDSGESPDAGRSLLEEIGAGAFDDGMPENFCDFYVRSGKGTSEDPYEYEQVADGAVPSGIAYYERRLSEVERTASAPDGFPAGYFVKKNETKYSQATGAFDANVTYFRGRFADKGIIRPGRLHKINWSIDISEAKDEFGAERVPAISKLADFLDSRGDIDKTRIFSSGAGFSIRFYASEAEIEYLKAPERAEAVKKLIRPTDDGGWGWEFFEIGDLPMISSESTEYVFAPVLTEYVSDESELGAPRRDGHTFMRWVDESDPPKPLEYPFYATGDMKIKAEFYENELGIDADDPTKSEPDAIGVVFEMNLPAGAPSTAPASIAGYEAEGVPTTLYIPNKIGEHAIMGIELSGVDESVRSLVLTNGSNFNGMNKNVFAEFASLESVRVLGSGADYKIAPLVLESEPDARGAYSREFQCMYSDDRSSARPYGSKLIAAFGTLGAAVESVKAERAASGADPFEPEFAFAVPEGVTEICENALANCGFKIVRLPETLKAIGSDAFGPKLEKLRVPSSIRLTDADRGAVSDDAPIWQAPAASAETAEYVEIFGMRREYAGLGHFYALANVLVAYETNNRIAASYGEGGFEFPSEVNGVQITALAGSSEDRPVFDKGGESASKLSLEKIILPKNIAAIGEHAFKDIDFSEIVDPDSYSSLSKIGENAFAETTYYESGSGNVALCVGKVLVRWKTATGDVSVKDGVEVISSDAFANSSVTRVALPAGIATIGARAFFSCVDLTEISIPKSAMTIGDDAFGKCFSLSSVSFDVNDSALISIGARAFDGCHSLSEVRLPFGLRELGEGAFSGCSALRKATFDGFSAAVDDKGQNIETLGEPSRLESLGRESFANCKKLENIVIPSRVDVIRERSFSDCSSLVGLAFGEDSKLREIEAEAFKGCKSLGGTLPLDVDNPSVTSASLYTLILPDRVVEIGASAFEGCSTLWGVALGSHIAKIGAKAFKACKNLVKVRIRRTAPPEIDGTSFDFADGDLYDKSSRPAGHYYRLRIYVEARPGHKIKDAYKTAWSGIGAEIDGKKDLISRHVYELVELPTLILEREERKDQQTDYIELDRREHVDILVNVMLVRANQTVTSWNYRELSDLIVEAGVARTSVRNREPNKASQANQGNYGAYGNQNWGKGKIQILIVDCDEMRMLEYSTVGA